MTITIEHQSHPNLEALLISVEHRIDAAVAKIAEHSHALEKHEPHTTSALAEAIRSNLQNDPISVGGYNLEVFAEELKPKQERVCGADLYISVIRADSYPKMSKGMLVQAKRIDAINDSDERKRLRNQCSRMRRRAQDDAYVWVYINGEVRCIKAPKSSSPALRAAHDDYQSVGQMIANAIRCNQGDEDLGLLDPDNVRDSLKSRLKNLGDPTGLAFRVTSGPKPARR